MRSLRWYSVVLVCFQPVSSLCLLSKAPGRTWSALISPQSKNHELLRNRLTPWPSLSGTQWRTVGLGQLLQETKGGDSFVEAGALNKGVRPMKQQSVLPVVESALDLLGSSTQWVVAGSVGAALVMRADSDTLVWVIGSLFNAILSKVLKKSINQAITHGGVSDLDAVTRELQTGEACVARADKEVRPDGSRQKGPGMPSSHAMSLCFLGTYLIMALQEYGMVDVGFSWWPLDAAGTQVLITVYAFTASLWRVKAGLHTLPQVSVGAVVGTLVAVLWYQVCRAFFLEQVELYFGGKDIPTQLVVSICLLAFFTFGDVRRRLAEAFGPRGNVVDKGL